MNKAPPRDPGTQYLPKTEAVSGQSPTRTFYPQANKYPVTDSSGLQLEGGGKSTEESLFEAQDCRQSLKLRVGASLVVQRLRIRLPMQGIRVRSLVREDPTCRRATKPVCHNY